MPLIGDATDLRVGGVHARGWSHTYGNVSDVFGLESTSFALITHMREKAHLTVALSQRLRSTFDIRHQH